MTKTRMALMAICTGLLTMPAFATVSPPIPTPEPTSLTLIATDIAGLLIGARFVRRK